MPVRVPRRVSLPGHAVRRLCRLAGCGPGGDPVAAVCRGCGRTGSVQSWVPACAGMTVLGAEAVRVPVGAMPCRAAHPHFVVTNEIRRMHAGCSLPSGKRRTSGRMSTFIPSPA